MIGRAYWPAVTGFGSSRASVVTTHAPLSVRQPDVAVQENGTLRDKAKPLAPNADGFAVSRIAAARPVVSIACGMSAFDPKRTSAAQKEGPPSLGARLSADNSAVVSDYHRNALPLVRACLGLMVSFVA